MSSEALSLPRQHRTRTWLKEKLHKRKVKIIYHLTFKTTTPSLVATSPVWPRKETRRLIFKHLKNRFCRNKHKRRFQSRSKNIPEPRFEPRAWRRKRSNAPFLKSLRWQKLKQTKAQFLQLFWKKIFATFFSFSDQRKKWENWFTRLPQDEKAKCRTHCKKNFMFKKNSNYFELIPMSNQTLTRFQEAGMAGFKKFAILKKN